MSHRARTRGMIVTLWSGSGARVIQQKRVPGLCNHIGFFLLLKPSAAFLPSAFVAGFPFRERDSFNATAATARFVIRSQFARITGVHALRPEDLSPRQLPCLQCRAVSRGLLRHADAVICDRNGPDAAARDRAHRPVCRRDNDEPSLVETSISTEVHHCLLALLGPPPRRDHGGRQRPIHR